MPKKKFRNGAAKRITQYRHETIEEALSRNYRTVKVNKSRCPRKAVPEKQRITGTHEWALVIEKSPFYARELRWSPAVRKAPTRSALLYAITEFDTGETDISVLPCSNNLVQTLAESRERLSCIFRAPIGKSVNPTKTLIITWGPAMIDARLPVWHRILNQFAPGGEQCAPKTP